MTLKYGIFDSDLAVWTNAEAWVLTGGVWREAEAFKMWDSAQVNVPESSVRRLLAEAPPLPDGAFAR